MSGEVLISGAGVAGMSLAYWLHRQGYAVTVVESAAALRGAGHAAGFRGAAIGVLDGMGLLSQMRDHATEMGAIALIDADGKPAGELPVRTVAGDLEVLKADVTRILHSSTADDVSYVFDDSITAIYHDEDGVGVAFARAAGRRFDLVIGADGVYSNVRRHVFGPHRDFVRHLGMSGVGFTTANRLGLDRESLLYRAPGRCVHLFSAGNPNRMTVSLWVATHSPDVDRLDRDTQERLVRERFAGVGWEVPRLLKEMRLAPDFSFSSACQIIMDRWSCGRVVLVGDAAYCAAPTTGMGASQALIGAHLLAARLMETAGDHTAAFPAYERELRPYIAENQAKGAEAAKAFAT
ncbi:FAD-binding protein [Nonomuraea sp. NN258]|uniref:FAD-dependent monooxygenase n=1 Tax=Nonomuraea antri TaxID=2730852 RepID=UPI001568E776|nr:FAD-dependent monooxygenase [Nonomuraea antri]NRQ30890.1 FAD-binding protein [Nonomuraea antri]